MNIPAYKHGQQVIVIRKPEVRTDGVYMNWLGTIFLPGKGDVQTNRKLVTVISRKLGVRVEGLKPNIDFVHNTPANRSLYREYQSTSFDS